MEPSPAGAGGNGVTVRIGLVWISQETNTFNPFPTTIETFASFGIDRGEEIVANLGTVGSPGGFFAAAAEREDVEAVPIFKARAVAGGRLSVETVDFLNDELVAGLQAAGPLDGLALQLHGACAAAGIDDVESLHLEAARGVLGDAVPIVLALDHHANITRRMVAGSDAIIGHRTQPHDPFNTGQVAAELLFRIVAGEVTPTVAWRKLPLLSHQEQYLTSQGPMKVWFDRAREHEAHDATVLQISNFPMQPWLDLEEGGWATVVTTDGDPALAERLADEMADLAWSMRADFQVKTSVAPIDAVRRADAAESGVVVISDTGDSVLGGAGGDSTVLLQAMIDAGITGPALVPLVDPAIATDLLEAGAGATTTVTAGGRIARMHDPVTLTGTVRRVGHEIADIGRGYASPTVDFGITAVLDVPFGTVVISERPGVGGVVPDMYHHLGIDPADYKMAVLKTASNFQWFGDISSDVIRADTTGPSQSDIVDLPWTRVPRPVYPLDDVADWR